MDIKKLQTAVVDALEDVKAQDIKIYDTTHLTSLFDRVAIASGTSNRQTKALAASVRDKVKAKGGHVVSVEGEDTGEWVLVDLGDMIVHIMQPAIRAYYRLEEIWGDKEVKMGAAKRVASSAAAKKASEDEKPAKIRRTREQAEAVEASQAIDDEAPKKPARKPRTTSVTTGAKPAPKTTPTRAPRASTTLSAAKNKAAAGTGTAAKRKAPAKKAVGTTVKVAMPKSAVASKKAAAAKRPARPKAKA